jgi:hypothetical protein
VVWHLTLLTGGEPQANLVLPHLKHGAAVALLGVGHEDLGRLNHSLNAFMALRWSARTCKQNSALIQFHWS